MVANVAPQLAHIQRRLDSDADAARPGGGGVGETGLVVEWGVGRKDAGLWSAA
jgi:hypothetical protein